MDLGFLDFFPDLDFRIRLDSLGCDQVSTGFGSASSAFCFLSDIGSPGQFTQWIRSKMASPDGTDFRTG
jgi:hypothetical protein